MNETFKYESKNKDNNFYFFLVNFAITIGFQISPNIISKIFDCLFDPFSSDKRINIGLDAFDIKPHYYYKEAIFKKLYEDEKIIKIVENKEEFQNYESKGGGEVNGNSTFIDNHHSYTKYKLASLFYQDLLITENPDIVNYTYSYELIINLYEYFKKNKNEIYLQVIESKIIFDLIINFKGLKENNEFLYNYYLYKIENESIEIFESKSQELKLNYTLQDLYNKKIDQIYADIIKSLIEKDKNNNFRNIEDILIELDLENIDITQAMIQYFSNLLNNYDVNLDKYIIKSFDDFSNADKINFYYILLKYLFKKSYLIYQIPFLLKTRNLLLKLKNNYLLRNSSLIFDDKSKYVLETILDSRYYSEKILKFHKVEEIYPQKIEFIESQEPNDDIFGISSEKTIIDLVKEIKGNITNNSYTYLISNEKKLCTCDKWFNINLNSNIEIDDIAHICQTSENSGENKIQYIACSKEFIILFIVESNKIHEKKRVEMHGCSLIFEIKKNLYLVAGIFGIKVIDGELEEKIEYENNNLKDKFFRSGIVIDQNIITLVYSDIKDKSDNKLLFYNFNSKQIVYEITGYSFLQSQKSLILFPEEKPRILLCSYENENIKEKGIIFINLDILNKTDSKIKIINNKKEFSNYINFYNTENFKSNCFCFLQRKIVDINNSNKDDKIYVQYFFAGGHEEIKEDKKDKDKVRIFGQVNLYQMIYNSSKFSIRLEKKQEIKLVDFEPTIDSMILTKENQNLLINCGQKTCIYKNPNINYYFNNSDITK